jgi:hypothetical protein
VKYDFFLCVMYNQIQHKLQMNDPPHTWNTISRENFVPAAAYAARDAAYAAASPAGIAATAANDLAQIPGCSSCRELAIATKKPNYKCQKCKQQQQNPKGGSKRKSKSQRRKKSKSQRRKKSIKRRH